LMVGLSNQIWPGQRWNMPKGGWQFGANGVRAIGADESRLRETTALWWANTRQGATGFFYAVAAPPARFEKSEPVFARILGSFRVTEANSGDGGGGGGGGGKQAGRDSGPLAGLQFQTWRDPAETAFTVEVPANWRVSGGLRRNQMMRVMDVVAQSPDGQFVRLGDTNLPTQFIEPSESLASLGYNEGMMYPGTNTPILNYRPGVNFATDYVQNMSAAHRCGGLQFTSQRPRPDYVQSLASQGLLTGNDQVDAGEVTFTCQSGGQPFEGYLFVQTTRGGQQGVGYMWHVTQLNGFLAPASRAAQASAVLLRMQGSFKVDIEWWKANHKADLRIRDEMQRTNEYISQLQQQTLNERWASQDRVTEQRGDVLRGHTRVVDPESGQAYKVESGNSYYWIDTRNDVIAGTNIPYAPTWDFREMVQTYR
jgi:hypothetical protein